MSIELLSVLFVGVFITILLLGVPLAFATGAVAVVFAYALFGLPGLTLVISRVFTLMGNYVLVSVPLFIFMACILERAGVAEAIFRSVHVWFGRVPGGLAVAVIFSCALMAMALLAPHIADKRLHVHLRTKAVSVEVEDDRIVSITAMNFDTGALLRFRPAMVLDATELGDLLPLAGAEYRVGAETIAQTGEQHAQPSESKPHCVQSFTYVFALERRPEGEKRVIAKPARYDFFRASQPYSLTIEVHGGEIYGEESGWLSYKMLETMPGTKGGLWTYRRLIDSAQFETRFETDISMFNWPGNDYREASIIDVPAQDAAAALQDAKRVSLGFLHWLQTEAPAIGEDVGLPEGKLRPDIMETPDGLAKYPYIRESRRIVALRTIVEQDVSVSFQKGQRAAHFEDSVGIGWYPIDIHRAGPQDVGLSCRTRPFQIPLGALIPIRVRNLIAAAKNIGATHITNGCYRLHPVEWNIGEAAGALAAYSLDRDRQPRSICEDENLMRAFQMSLVEEGIPLAWLIDVGIEHPAFEAVQWLAMHSKMADFPDLTFAPDAPISPTQWNAWGGHGDVPANRAAAAIRLKEAYIDGQADENSP